LPFQPPEPPLSRLAAAAGSLRAELPELLGYLGKWLLLAAPTGALIGSACALFLWSLDAVTALRWQHAWLLYLLPVAGVMVGGVYHWVGRPVEGGNNLIVDQIHTPGGGVPLRIVPLVLFGTLATHLCGGSAGREGTAVQMGGGIASAVARSLRWLSTNDHRTLLMAGIAGGFGGVFGTPLAGTIFAMEVLVIGRLSYQAVLPCLLMAIVADSTCTAWGIAHMPYRITSLAVAPGQPLTMDWSLLAKVALAGVAFGLLARCFVVAIAMLRAAVSQRVATTWLRPALGGAAVIVLAWIFGSDFLGIGVQHPDPAVVTIESAFRDGGATSWSWLWKLLFTVVTLACGFKGGEVTPLFYLGATLGHALAAPLGVPVDLLAGLGFVAVFAAAANTPLACTIMAVELFGVGVGPNVVYFAVVCFTAYFFAGHSGIYRSQRWDGSKLG